MSVPVKPVAVSAIMQRKSPASVMVFGAFASDENLSTFHFIKAALDIKTFY